MVNSGIAAGCYGHINSVQRSLIPVDTRPAQARNRGGLAGEGEGSSVLAALAPSRRAQADVDINGLFLPPFLLTFFPPPLLVFFPCFVPFSVPSFFSCMFLTFFP